VSSYDSFNRIQQNVHDDMKVNNNGDSPHQTASPRSHDPYRFTRSTAQPVPKTNERSPMPNKAPEYPTKFRYTKLQN
jgi:hypothetical protein